MDQNIQKKSTYDFSLMIQLFVYAVFLLALGIWLLTPQYKSLFIQYVKKPAVNEPVATIGKARITFDFGAKKRIFEGPIISGETVSQALNQASLAGNMNLIWKEIGGMSSLTGVDTYLNGKKTWVAYLNGTKLEFSLFERKIKPNDEILLVYQQ